MRMVLTFFLMMLVASNGMADTTKQEKAAYIIERENFRGQIVARTDEAINESIKQLNAALDQELDDQTRDMIRAQMKEIVQGLVDNYMMDVVNIYLEHLTDREIDAIYEFYLSPEGKSIGDKLPEIESQIYLINVRYLKLLSEQSVSRLADQFASPP